MPGIPLTPIRVKAVAYYLTLVGYCEDEERYQKLIDPNDVPGRAALVAQESGCCLCVLGEQDAIFEMPPRVAYVNGSAFPIHYKRCGGSPMAYGNCCYEPGPDKIPQPGDWVEYGPLVHIEACTDVRMDGDQLVGWFVAGGERTTSENPPAGRETIAVMKRTFNLVNGKWVDAANQRTMTAIFDLDDFASNWTSR